MCSKHVSSCVCVCKSPVHDLPGAAWMMNLRLSLRPWSESPMHHPPSTLPSTRPELSQGCGRGPCRNDRVQGRVHCRSGQPTTIHSVRFTNVCAEPCNLVGHYQFFTFAG